MFMRCPLKVGRRSRLGKIWSTFLLNAPLVKAFSNVMLKILPSDRDITHLMIAKRDFKHILGAGQIAKKINIGDLT